MTSLVTNISNLATRISSENKSLRTLINGNAVDLSSLTTTAKSNIILALNELKTTIDTVAASGGATINDASSSSTTQTYSINKIISTVNAAISAVTAGAPTALDTLDELAAALGDDGNFAATITTALGNRVRIDATQSLTTEQKAQARTNIGADITSADIGDTSTDFTAIFTSGLV